MGVEVESAKGKRRLLTCFRKGDLRRIKSESDFSSRRENKECIEQNLKLRVSASEEQTPYRQALNHFKKPSRYY